MKIKSWFWFVFLLVEYLIAFSVISNRIINKVSGLEARETLVLTIIQVILIPFSILLIYYSEDESKRLK